MPKVKLVLCDMDGTLVPFGSDGVSSRTLGAIRALHEAGIEFGPSSGREKSDLIGFFRGETSCIASGIMGGGKLVYLNGSLVYRRPLPRHQLELLAEAVRGIRGVSLNLYKPLDAKGEGEPGFLCYGITEDERRMFGGYIGEELISELPEGDITTGAVIVAEPEALAADVHPVLAAAAPGLEFPMPAPAVFDVLEKGWSKVSALPILLDALRIEPDEVAYFGDSQNDLTMMRALTNTFCLGNGSDEAKAAARWIIDSCENDGAAKVMESLARHDGELVESDWI